MDNGHFLGKDKGGLHRRREGRRRASFFLSRLASKSKLSVACAILAWQMVKEGRGESFSEGLVLGSESELRRAGGVCVDPSVKRWDFNLVVREMR